MIENSSLADGDIRSKGCLRHRQVLITGNEDRTRRTDFNPFSSTIIRHALRLVINSSFFASNPIFLSLSNKLAEDSFVELEQNMKGMRADRKRSMDLTAEGVLSEPI